ncbi:TPA: hypothetical protein ACF3TU_000592 [Enterococcus faecium]
MSKVKQFLKNKMAKRVTKDLSEGTRKRGNIESPIVFGQWFYSVKKPSDDQK